MAIITGGLFGQVKKSIGDVVFSNWKGINTARRKPQNVANPNTQAQQDQRSRMKNVSDFASAVNAAVIKPLNDRFAVRMSGYNLFQSRNVGLFIARDPNPAGDLILSQGSLLVADLTGTIEGNTIQQARATWVDNAGDSNAVGTDQVYMVCQNKDNGEVVAQTAVVTRADQLIIAEFLETVNSGDTILVWVSFRKADGTIVSNTQFGTYVAA